MTAKEKEIVKKLIARRCAGKDSIDREAVHAAVDVVLEFLQLQRRQPDAGE